MLRSHQEGSIFLNDVLNVIEGKLLQVNQEHRGRAGTLVDEFRRISKKCSRVGNYCAPRREMRQLDVPLPKSQDPVAVPPQKPSQRWGWSRRIGNFFRALGNFLR